MAAHRARVDTLKFGQQVRPGTCRNQQSASLAIRFQQSWGKQIHPAMAALPAHNYWMLEMWGSILPHTGCPLFLGF
jgi:hypothetical protein